ncbi:MAG: phosphotransferase [Candidatus Promineifilaceae bacterium]|nr:phosphotransferase [Candidatus Promineifilaceae bacterium]
MEQIAVTRSIVDARALGSVINAEYPFDEPVVCRLISKTLRTQDNDHYLVTVGKRRYVARLYQVGTHLDREASDYLYELDWLTFLHDEGLPVAYPIRRSDGGMLGQVQAPEGVRHYALFSFAPGRPMADDDPDQLFALGQEMARIHVASNDYQSEYQRKEMDLEFLVDRPVARLKEFWGDTEDDRLEILLTSAEEAKEEILALLRNPEHTEDSWGPIGGDFHPTNTHVDAGGQPTFFNFDLCGPGWRAYDIAAFLLNADLFQHDSALSEAFFAGYYTVRPLSHNEHAAIAPFLTIRRVWLTGTFSAVEGVAGYTFIAPANLEGY